MNDFFGGVYVVSIPDAIERRKAMETELDRVGITSRRFVGVRPPPHGFSIGNMRRNPRAEFGCNLSHLQAISHAIRDGVESALFLEDDVRFVGDPTEALSELPDSWSMVFLGGHPRGPCKRYSKSLVSISSFSFAESYGMTWEAMREFQDYWFSRIAQPQAMYDFCLSDYAKTKESYACFPLLTKQAIGVSQISGKKDERGPLVDKGWRENLSV